MDVRKHFEWLHLHPELSYAEHETTAYIRKTLKALDIEIIDTGLKTGLVASIGGGPGRVCAALRADIDAIPVNGSPMHACGHDFHAAALLGAAQILKQREKKLAGEIRLIFQPAEEVSGGAQTVMDTGALAGVREIYGLHCAPNYESGVVALKAGGTFAAVIAFKILITGKGGHAAIPQLNRDPVVAASALVTAAQSIVSRNCDPFDNVVLSFCRIEAGRVWNVIPGEAVLEGTIRALSAEKARAVAKRLEEMCSGICACYEVANKTDWWMDAPATNNDPELTRRTEDAAREAGFTVVEYTPTMAGEDFALYQQTIPGVFVNFGVGSPAGLHHPEFCADIAVLPKAAELLAVLAEKALQRICNLV